MSLGGRVASVGVGGLTLGGGISFYSNQYGWVCDSVISYEIVLPNGKIMDVTQKSSPDLYKALRGAGQTNFGVITAFTYEAFKPSSPKIWDTQRMYSWDKLEALTKLHAKYFLSPTNVIEKTGGWFGFGYIVDYDMWVIVDRYVNTAHTDLETWPEAFEPFKSIEPAPNTEAVTLRPFSNITIEVDNLSPFGHRNLYATFTYKPSEPVMLAILEIFKEEADRIKTDVDQILPVIVWQLLSQNTIKHMQKNGGSAISMSLKPEEAPLAIMNLAIRWAKAEDDEKITTMLDAFLTRAEAKAKEMNAWHPFKYVNYAHSSQNVIQGFGKDGVEWLRKVQKDIDPKRTFTRAGLNKGAFDLYLETAFDDKETTVRDEL
jgi:FAD binding domain-containing protein